MSHDEESGAPTRLWARVDLDAVVHNVRQIKSLLKKSATLMAVVKDNAYGHGAVEVARAALAAGAQWLAVADVAEGIALRHAGLTEVPILILGPCPRGEFRPGIEAGLTFSVSAKDDVKQLAECTRAVNQGLRRGRRTRVHLLLDTGMGRAGFAPQELWPAVERVRAEQTLELEGVFTHFSSADEPDPGPTVEQIQLFRKTVQYVTEERGGQRFRVRHAANSAGTVFFPEAHLDLVRCGVMLHGLRGWPATRDRLDLKPALSLHTRIVHLGRRPPGWHVGYNRTYQTSRESLLATLPAGYASGYPRALGGQTGVLIRGQRVPVVGRISMDYMVADVTAMLYSPSGPPEVGDEATLIGAQGDERISTEELARACGTIPYTITTQLTDKVARVYVNRAAELARGDDELPHLLRAAGAPDAPPPSVAPDEGRPRFEPQADLPLPQDARRQAAAGG